MPEPEPPDADLHRRWAADLFNATWALLDQAERTSAEADRMVHSAHASRLHWELAGGTPTNFSIGEWQIARVYSVLGRAEPALCHARRCLEITESNGITGFFLGAAHEGMARALLLAGQPAMARKHHETATAICRQLTDDEDRSLLSADLASIPI